MAIPLDTSSAIAIFIVLLVSISERPWSTSEALTQDCHAPEVTEDQTGMMIFFIDRRVNFASDHFFANLIRSHEPDWDILNCDQPNGTSHVSCKINSPKYKYSGVKDHKLTVFIPNITQHYADTYVFQVYINGIAQPPVFCSVSVKKRLKPHINTVIKTESTTTPWVIAGVIFLAIGSLTLVVFLVVFHRQRICGSCSNDDETSRRPLLKIRKRNESLDSLEEKRWFVPSLTKEDEIKMLQSDNTKPGSFLVTLGSTNPTHVLLAVYFDGIVRRFPISREAHGVTFLETGTLFQTLAQLVHYYKHNAIEAGDNVWGKLSRHFRREPEDEWYFGKFTRQEEEDMLRTEANEPGLFMVRDGITDPDDYVLAVSFEGKMKHFQIIEEDDGFRFRDSGKLFKTLTQVVDFYQQNAICVGDKTYGKLSTPFQKEKLDQLYLETFTRNDDNKFLQSKRKRPGSFLITVDIRNDNNYILAVYFEGAIHRFLISREGTGYKLLDTGRTFRTLPGLLNYYRLHAIEVGNKVWGQLSGRFRTEPKEDWYVGPLRREDEKKMLLATENKQGAFLVSDGETDQDNYVLAMYFDGEIERYLIIREGTGFKLINADITFESLPALVEYYQVNIIPPVYKGDLHRLSHPCAKDPPDIWYCVRFTREDEKLYLQSKRTRQGSFIITSEGDMQSVYTLAVFFDGKIIKFQVTQKENGFVFETTNRFFYTWCELVDYYRRHDIKAGDIMCGKLSRPLRKEPTETWYFANTTAEEETAFFRRSAEGSFLIRDGTTESDEYVLAVRLNGTTKHFLITPEEDGFKFGDSVTVFGTLAELVQHYQENDILFVGTSFGRLGTPLRRN